MGIKDTPTSYRVYFKAFKEAIDFKYDNAVEESNKLLEEQIELRSYLIEHKKTLNFSYGIDIDKQEEFVKDKYIDGSLIKLINKQLLVTEVKRKITGGRLARYASNQKSLYTLEIKIKKYNKLKSVSLKEYNSYLQTFFMEVQRQMIKFGYGYNLGNKIGTIIINRCRLVNSRPKIDFAATKANKKKFIEEGKRIYNQEEENFCKVNGLDYNAEDYRVFMKKEYVYEIPLIYSGLSSDIKFEVSDYRHNSLKGRTNKSIVEECHNNVDEILKLRMDIRTKLHMCIDNDKLLYSKFIRNEAQQPIATSKAYRKNR